MSDIKRTAKGQWARDDTAMAQALLVMLDIQRRTLALYELFADLPKEQRRDMSDPIYADISAMVAQVQQIDKRKEGDHA
jgi:hypothetical protein